MDECEFLHEHRRYWSNISDVSSQVHINDLVELYLLVLSLALSGTDKSSSYAKFYFGSVHEHVWGDVIRQIGQILYDKRVIPTPQAKSVTLQKERRLL